MVQPLERRQRSGCTRIEAQRDLVELGGTLGAARLGFGQPRSLCDQRRAMPRIVGHRVCGLLEHAVHLGPLLLFAVADDQRAKDGRVGAIQLERGGVRVARRVFAPQHVLEQSPLRVKQHRFLRRVGGDPHLFVEERERRLVAPSRDQGAPGAAQGRKTLGLTFQRLLVVARRAP